MKHDLNGTWQLSFTAPDGIHQMIQAAVPGNVEISLMDSGLMDDCMPADDLHATTLFDTVDDWTYQTRFEAPQVPADWTQELVFEGIDTIAEVYLNGELLGKPQNMFIAHRYDVRERLLPGWNEVKVVIRSALLWARQQETDLFALSREHTVYGGQPYLRKARHEWGWDNAPRLLTSGLYRSVYVESLPPERFEDVYLYTAKLDTKYVHLGIAWDYQTMQTDMSPYEIRYTLSCEGEIVYQAQLPVEYPRGVNRFRVPREQVKLWWPRGFGEATLCHIQLEMLRNGQPAAMWSSPWGIRTVRVIRSADITEDGKGQYLFEVNQHPVYIRGTNWKALDALHSRADAKVERALIMVTDLNCNMVRIWGGGIYEDHPFFDYCDQHGILVWQDFMLACEIPPVNDGFQRVMEEEARFIIRKLRNHPSLALWCGDNEDDMFLAGSVHGASTILPSDMRCSRETLRACVLRYDPHRSYVEGSPCLSDAYMTDRRNGKIFHHPPEYHLYPAPLDNSKAIRECKSRLIAETGPCPICAVTDNEHIFAREEARARRLWNTPIDAASRNITCHQTDDYFSSWRQRCRETCLAWYGRDFSWEERQDFFLAVNIICAELFKETIEFCRMDRWNKTGVIWWSLMDMWPMLFNFSVVDCDFQHKLAYEWIRHSQQPFALTVVRYEEGDEAALYAVNDTLSSQRGTYRIISVTADGTETLLAMGTCAEQPNGARMLQRLAEPESPQLWLIEWEINGERYCNHFVTDSRGAGFDTWKKWNNRINAAYRRT